MRLVRVVEWGGRCVEDCSVLGALRGEVSQGKDSKSQEVSRESQSNLEIEILFLQNIFQHYVLSWR